MAIRKLDKGSWLPFFNDVSKSHPTAEVEVEVMGEDVGDQYSVEWVSWRGATYDDKSDVLEVFTDTLAHRIPSPREIYVDDSAAALASVQVLDGDGNTQIIRLREPAPPAELPPSTQG